RDAPCAETRRTRAGGRFRGAGSGEKRVSRSLLPPWPSHAARHRRAIDGRRFEACRKWRCRIPQSAVWAREGAVTSKLLLILITLVATAGYLGLAVWGAGGIDDFISEPARIALVIVGSALGIAALFSSGHIGAGEREDRGNRWVIVVFGVVGLLLGYLPAYTERRGFWTIDGDAVRWLGVLLFPASPALPLSPLHLLAPPLTTP